MPDFLSIIAHASHNLLWIVIKGGLIMIPLMASSIIALTVIVERLCFWRRLRAITTLISYNYSRSKVEQLTDLMEEQATRLELLLGKREE